MYVMDLFALRWDIGSTFFDLDGGDSNLFTLDALSLHNNTDIFKAENMEDAGLQFARIRKYLLFTGCNLKLPLSEFWAQK
jgi:hypothetical protein